MDELVKTFHIDWRLLIAQIINFGIVLGILWYFALKPLMKVMNKRNEDIEQSLKNAEEIEKRLKAAGESKEQMILEAKKESQVIMENANKESEQLKNSKIAETRSEIENIAAKTKASLLADKEKMITDARKEVGGLIIEASSKIIGRNIDSETNRKMVEETVKKIKE
ncbi:F0F1 ATP synthase subunit B [Patescibacteria group bacterium]|nr:F0F1 ATP synthase subunit B [Patescibacteria group bacterium]